MTDIRAATTPESTPSMPSMLASRRGVLILLLLCAVQFLDIVDSSIVNVALPSIRDDLHFSQQNLQWVLSGYIVTYGGFLLLGGRAADLLGRRRMLVTGTVVFAVCSLVAGISPNSGSLIAARVAQGVGAAMMAPAGLSILTTTFSDAKDRAKALGAWGGVSGLAAAVGVFLGGVLSDGPGWRWVFYVNIPVCAAVIAATYSLLPGRDAETPRKATSFDVPGAILVTGGMLLMLYALVEAPDRGWGSTRIISELIGAGLLLVAFVINELRSRSPLFPFSILRVKGLAAADATQLIAFAGFYSLFFFLTLYMQNVLGWSPMKAGSAYVPVTVGLAISAGLSSQLIAKIGTRPLIVGGALFAAAGMFLFTRTPVHGSYASDVLPGLLVMSVGLGAVFVTATVAANAGVPPEKAGLAAGLINTSQQIGGALGLAIFSAIATGRTNHLLANHVATPEALNSGFHRAFLGAAIAALIAAVIAVRAPNTHNQNPAASDPGAAADQVPSAPRSVPSPVE